MISEKLHALDIRLLAKVFIPIANWIDTNWHINPWQLAAKIMMVSAVLAVLDLVYSAKLTMGGILWHAFLAIIILLVRAADIWKLTKISDQYERRPDIMPADWIIFAQPISRMMHLFLGFMITIPSALAAGIHAYHGILPFLFYFVPQMWFPLAGVGYYFAGVLRPPAKRKEKKVNVPLGATLAGIKL